MTTPELVAIVVVAIVAISCLAVIVSCVRLASGEFPAPDFDRHADEAMRVGNPAPLSEDFVKWDRELQS